MGDAGVSEIISACSSTSRAVSRPDAGTSDVAAAGGEEVGDVGAACATQERGHALLEEHPLDHLGLRLVGRADDADELPLAELRLDLPHALTEGVVLPGVIR